MTVPIPPAVVLDGECGFCRRWTDRHRRHARDVEFIEFQRLGAEGFRGIPKKDLERCIWYFPVDGKPLRAGHAALALRAHGRRSFLLWAYRRIPPFRWIVEATYRWVASHRGFVSRWF